MDPAIRKELMEKPALPVRTVSLVLGTGEYAVYQGIKSNNIPSIRVGRKILVPTAPLRRMLGIDDAA